MFIYTADANLFGAVATACMQQASASAEAEREALKAVAKRAAGSSSNGSSSSSKPVATVDLSNLGGASKKQRTS